MKAALAGAVLSTAITVLALPRTAASDTYWTIIGLGMLPYAALGVAARLTARRWLSVSIVVYTVLDVSLRALRLLGPESLRNPLVVVTLPLLAAPGIVLAAGVVLLWLRWRAGRSVAK